MRWFWIGCFTALGCLAQDDLARARRLQSEAIGIDTHIDTAQRLLIENADISKRLSDGQVDLPRLREGGMHAPFFSLWVPVYYHGAEAIRRIPLGRSTAKRRNGWKTALVFLVTREKPGESETGERASVWLLLMSIGWDKGASGGAIARVGQG